MPHAIRLFYSYSHQDEQLRDKLETHLALLKRQGLIEAWHDHKILPGDEWAGEVDEHLNEAAIVLLLISPDFLASDYCYDVEMKRAMERHEAAEAVVIPIILRPCDWLSAAFGKLQGAPKNAKPVTTWSNQDEAFLDVVKAIRNAVHTINLTNVGQLHDESGRVDAGKRLWNVPHARLEYFSGRDEFLTNLHGSLDENPHQAVTGLGGIGKTQTAVEYAYRNRDAYKAVFWVGANTEFELTTGFVNIADELGLAYDKSDVSSAVSAVKRWLSNNTSWLFIFDNADHPNIVKSYQPTTDRGHVLFTSRASVVDMLGITRPVELPQLTTREATDFLFRRTGRDGGDEAERHAAEKLSEELEGLPLALEQAGAYIIRTRVSFCRYLDNYEKHKIAMFKKYGPVTGDYTESVATTWLINFEEVKQISAASADLLRFSAFLSPDHIPFELIANSGEQLGATLHEFMSRFDDTSLAVSEALEPLTRFSLIRLDAANESYSMHRLVQEVLKERDDT